jgi:hypothetical protein
MEYAWTECTVPEALHLYHQAQRMCADAVKLAQSSGEVVYGLQVTSALNLAAPLHISATCSIERAKPSRVAAALTSRCRWKQQPLAREERRLFQMNATIDSLGIAPHDSAWSSISWLQRSVR